MGTCAECGAEVYGPAVWHGVIPPPMEYACLRSPQCVTPKMGLPNVGDPIPEISPEFLEKLNDLKTMPLDFVDTNHPSVFNWGNERKCVMGIDVGKQGGFAKLYEDGELQLFTMPMIGKEYDVQEVINILMPQFGKEKITHVVIENVHAIQGRAGATSNFQFGLGKGLLIGIVAAMSHRYTLVNPKQWQKVAWEGVTKQSDNKKTSLVAAKRLFPKETFVPTERSRKAHDGLVDAALMAYYAKITYGI